MDNGNSVPGFGHQMTTGQANTTSGALNLNQIRNKAKIPGAKLTSVERAFLAAYDNHALFAWLIDQNPGNINDTLRHTYGYNLSFVPDKKSIAAQLNMLLDKNDWTKLNVVLANYKFKDGSAFDTDFVSNFVKFAANAKANGQHNYHISKSEAANGHSCANGFTTQKNSDGSLTCIFIQ